MSVESRQKHFLEYLSQTFVSHKSQNGSPALALTFLWRRLKFESFGKAFKSGAANIFTAGTSISSPFHLKILRIRWIGELRLLHDGCQLLEGLVLVEVGLISAGNHVNDNVRVAFSSSWVVVQIAARLAQEIVVNRVEVVHGRRWRHHVAVRWPLADAQIVHVIVQDVVRDVRAGAN